MNPCPFCGEVGRCTNGVVVCENRDCFVDCYQMKKNPNTVYVREWETHTKAKHTYWSILLTRENPGKVVGFKADDPVVSI